MQRGKLFRWVVDAACYPDQFFQLLLLEHVADSQGVELDVTSASGGGRVRSVAVATGIPAIGDEDQGPDQRRVVLPAREES